MRPVNARPVIPPYRGCLPVLVVGQPSKLMPPFAVSVATIHSLILPPWWQPRPNRNRNLNPSHQSRHPTVASIAPPPVAPPPVPAATRLQTEIASLQHLQTDSKIELPLHLSVIHVGKPNDRIPPDIDVSGFPDSDIVSRVHADIRVEGGIYYLEDSGSANGTYVNHTPLPPGNRHRLRAGDRISLGKGDKMTFIWQMS